MPENEELSFESTQAVVEWGRAEGLVTDGTRDAVLELLEKSQEQLEETPAEQPLDWRYDSHTFGAYISETKHHIRLTRLGLFLMLTVAGFLVSPPAGVLPLALSKGADCLKKQASFWIEIGSREFCVYLAAYHRFLCHPFRAEEMIADRKRNRCDTHTDKWRCPYARKENRDLCEMTEQNVEDALHSLTEKGCFRYRDGYYELTL